MDSRNGRCAVTANEALERNAQSFIKRTIAACTGLGDEHRDTVSLIGRLSWNALHQRLSETGSCLGG